MNLQQLFETEDMYRREVADFPGMDRRLSPQFLASCTYIIEHLERMSEDTDVENSLYAVKRMKNAKTKLDARRIFDSIDSIDREYILDCFKRKRNEEPVSQYENSFFNEINWARDKGPTYDMWTPREELERRYKNRRDFG